MTLLAEKLKLKRKELGLSQKELAAGICGQSQLSKLERGNFIPSADMLFKLSQRLEVPLDYFFNEEIEVKSNLSNFKELSSKLLEDRNYDNLDYLYKLEIEKSSSLSYEDQAYLKWIKAILDFYKYGKKDSAIADLEHSLINLSNKKVVYLKILNTLSNFYSLIGREEDYENNYKILIDIYQTKDLDSQEFLFGYIRIRYNYAHYLLSKERYMDAVKLALETIDLCKKAQTTYQLAPLLIIVANAGEHFMDKEERLKYYWDARELCRLYDNKLTLMKIDDHINKLVNDKK